jgi:hypothetical protein
MSIELIQTMQWTNLCWEDSFESIIELNIVISDRVKKATEIFEANEYTLQENQIYGAEYW